MALPRLSKACLRCLCLVWLSLTPITVALKYDPEQATWNLNTNQSATDPLDYSGAWQGHVFTPSPSNWRMPFYTIMLDRFVNGNPSNDDANGTQYEHDITQTQLRHGGDIQGLEDSLDYLQGMGIKVSRRNAASVKGSMLMVYRCSTSLGVLTSTYHGPRMAIAPSISHSWTITLVPLQNGKLQLQKYTGEGCMWF